MSEIPKSKTTRLDRPAAEYVAGNLEPLRELLFDALDNGALSRRTLEKAANMGKKTLAQYGTHDSAWYVYAELSPDVCVMRNLGEFSELTPHAGYPTNIYGELVDFAVEEHPNGRDMLYAHVESLGVGQYDQYIVPIAYAGDTTTYVQAGETKRQMARIMDMPSLSRDTYVQRVKSKELAVAEAFADFIGETTRNGKDVTAYLRERLRSAGENGLQRYQTGLNMMFEDTYYIGEPFVVDMRECWARVEYDHENNVEQGVCTKLHESQGRVLGVSLPRDEHGVLVPEWLVELNDGDVVVSLGMDDRFSLSSGDSVQD